MLDLWFVGLCQGEGALCLGGTAGDMGGDAGDMGWGCRKVDGRMTMSTMSTMSTMLTMSTMFTGWLLCSVMTTLTLHANPTPLNSDKKPLA